MAAVQLSQTLYMLAWTMARAHPVCAKIAFGMSAECLRTFRVLPSIESLIDESWSWLRPRWADRPAVWRRLIGTAHQSASAKIPGVDVRAMLQAFGDLEPATREACENHALHR